MALLGKTEFAIICSNEAGCKQLDKHSSEIIEVVSLFCGRVQIPLFLESSVYTHKSFLYTYILRQK